MTLTLNKNIYIFFVSSLFVLSLFFSRRQIKRERKNNNVVAFQGLEIFSSEGGAYAPLDSIKQGQCPLPNGWTRLFQKKR